MSFNGKGNVEYRRERIVNLKKEKGGHCWQCGYNKNYAALDFHHFDPSIKSFGVNSNSKGTLDELRKEAEKCVLLCRNCHSELHHPKMMGVLFPDPLPIILLPETDEVAPEQERLTTATPEIYSNVIPMKKQHEDYIIKLRSDCISHKSIAERCSVSTALVYRICKKAGINLGSEQTRLQLEDFCKRYPIINGLPDMPYRPSK